MRLPVAGAGRIIQTSDRQADAVDRQRLRAVAQHTDAAVLDAGKDILRVSAPVFVIAGDITARCDRCDLPEQHPGAALRPLIVHDIAAKRDQIRLQVCDPLEQRQLVFPVDVAVQVGKHNHPKPLPCRQLFGLDGIGAHGQAALQTGNADAGGAEQQCTGGTLFRSHCFSLHKKA